MPLDQEPCADGNIAVEGDVARVLKKGEEYDGPRYKSHFATCPAAAAFRRR